MSDVEPKRKAEKVLKTETKEVVCINVPESVKKGISRKSIK